MRLHAKGEAPVSTHPVPRSCSTVFQAACVASVPRFDWFRTPDLSCFKFLRVHARGRTFKWRIKFTSMSTERIDRFAQRKTHSRIVSERGKNRFEKVYTALRALAALATDQRVPLFSSQKFDLFGMFGSAEPTDK